MREPTRPPVGMIKPPPPPAPPRRRAPSVEDACGKAVQKPVQSVLDSAHPRVPYMERARAEEYLLEQRGAVEWHGLINEIWKHEYLGAGVTARVAFIAFVHVAAHHFVAGAGALSMPNAVPGEYAVAANVMNGDSGLRIGARVLVLQVGGMVDTVRVRGLSRGGRMIRKWIRIKKLSNIRAVWLHESQREEVPCSTKSKAEERALFIANMGRRPLVAHDSEAR